MLLEKGTEDKLSGKGYASPIVTRSIFLLYAWNEGLVDGTDIAKSLVAIGIEFPYPIELSPERSQEFNS